MIITAAVEAAVGAKCQFHPLKSGRTRKARLLHRLRFDGAGDGLSPYRVEAADRRTFKLLVAEETNRLAVASLLIRYNIVASLDCAPRLIWHDDHTLLLDFVQGELPDMRNPECAAAFGRSLAQIYGQGVDTLPASTVMRTADKYIEDLAGAGLLEAGLADRVHGRLSARLPAHLRTSADYGDVQPRNFIIEPNGHLKFIDIGGFQVGRLTGDGFFGHPGSRTLDQDSFVAAYKAASGPDDVFEFRDVIVALSDLRRGARLAAWANGIKFLEPRRARSFRARATGFVESLRDFSNAASAHVN